METHEKATIEELEKYFDVRTHSKSAVSSSVLTILVALLAAVVGAYIAIVQGADQIWVMAFAFILMMIMVAIVGMAVMNMRKVMSPKGIDANFDMYLAARYKLQQSKEIPVSPENLDEGQQ